MVERIVSRGASSRQEDDFSLAAASLAQQQPLQSPSLQQIASCLRLNRLQVAGKQLSNYRAEHPDDPAALHLGAQLENRLDRPAKAALLLARCLELEPDFIAARFDYANTLRSLQEFVPALGEAETLLRKDAHNPLFLQLKAGILTAIGEVGTALPIWEQLTNRYPARAESWRKYGDALRALGFRDKAIAAYRRAIECRPSFGLAWWSLASLQVFRFGEADIVAMQDQVQRSDLASEDRVDLLFALGKAHEDLGGYENSYNFYAKANAEKRLKRSDAAQLRRSGAAGRVAGLSAAFMYSGGAGCPASDPIFVVGRPRSGSTLVEQILCSHPDVEGTDELPYIAGLASRLREGSGHGTGYTHILEKLDASEIRALGEEYLRKVRQHRRLGRRFFVDKTPNNYHHLGLIQLILPNARIIDVRRNPAANCFSIFKLNYRGASLDLNELGRVYRDYVELMAQFDRELPGRIHRVIYEELIGDSETEIRRMLDYVGLPFDEKCLRFYQTDRAVRTPSSEQVRRPISGEGIDHWRNFEPWLAPLLASLGNVLTQYPNVPEQLRGAHEPDALAREV